jgi:hypothetical protein
MVSAWTISIFEASELPPELVKLMLENFIFPKSARGYLPPPGRSTIHSAVPRLQTTVALHDWVVEKLRPWSSRSVSVHRNCLCRLPMSQ